MDQYLYLLCGNSNVLYENAFFDVQLELGSQRQVLHTETPPAMVCLPVGELMDLSSVYHMRRMIVRSQSLLLDTMIFCHLLFSLSSRVHLCSCVR